MQGAPLDEAGAWIWHFTVITGSCLSTLITSGLCQRPVLAYCSKYGIFLFQEDGNVANALHIHNTVDLNNSCYVELEMA